MVRAHNADEFAIDRAWVWTPDAAGRWRRALRLLLAESADDTLAVEQEDDHGTDRGSVCAGLDRAPGRAADE